MTKGIRVRFAPSPTGPLHAGNMRTAVFNWLFARKNGGKFVLRIEDTDVERSGDEHTKEIFDSLHWLGIDWDGEPQYQSQRTGIYQEKIDALLKSGVLYPCFCSDEVLEEDRKAAEKRGRPPVYVGRCSGLPEEERNKRKVTEPHSLRFKVSGETLTYTDAIRGQITVNTGLIGDFILVRSNGTVTYNLAASVDDAMMGISHVIRGEDHISNTPKQILLMRAMGFEGHPIYAHLPIILSEEGTKLSKRHRNSAFGDLIKLGYLPEAVLNFLALMGWRPEESGEEMPAERMIREFSLDRVSLRAAHYNLQKLDWLNKHHILHADPARLLELSKPFIQKYSAEFGSLSTERRLALISAEKENISRLDELEAGLAPFLNYSVEPDALAEMGAFAAKDVAEALLKTCETPDYETAIGEVIGATGAKGKKLFMPVRVALMGRLKGPELKKIYEFLTPAERKARVENFLRLI
jgi:nondiscriminating glutamyl-tRNA synthetase